VPPIHERYNRIVIFEVSIAILNHIAAPRALQQQRPLATLREARERTTQALAFLQAY
jgi:hypothetical protein